MRSSRRPGRAAVRRPGVDRIDTPHGAEFIDAPAQLRRYRTKLERVDSVALTEHASLGLIRCIAQEL
ncbi:Scr1 family TA system antitoxin-like transcriptional regulator [Streptomyces sp. NPDC057621]|uniref:Scr1 family TA system antitoxin-like transcriptional regulator n=1 Tax=unclassified Streptomyces TaxID=2593676 RepID=UPI00369F0311